MTCWLTADSCRTVIAHSHTTPQDHAILYHVVPLNEPTQGYPFIDILTVTFLPRKAMVYAIIVSVSRKSVFYWRDSSFLMLKISAKLTRDQPQRRCQMQARQVEIGDFWQITHCNSKTLTIRSIVNLVRLQVYHTEHPPLFAAHLLWCSTRSAG